MTKRHITDGGFEGDSPEQSLALTYDVDTDELHSEAVVRAVAGLTDTSPLELDPLYDVVDPVHLDGIFETSEPASVTKGTFAFTFGGCRVTVTHEEIRVREINGASPG